MKKEGVVSGVVSIRYIRGVMWDKENSYLWVRTVQYVYLILSPAEEYKIFFERLVGELSYLE